MHQAGPFIYGLPLNLSFCHVSQAYFCNLVPRASPRLTWRLGETPGQGCWNTPRIVEYFVTWHMMKWLLRRLFPTPGSPVYFLPIWRHFHLVLRDKIFTNFWSHVAALARGFSDPPFWMRRRPWEARLIFLLWSCETHINQPLYERKKKKIEFL